MPSSKLIFVYNAESGFFNALTDYAHKLVSPTTYECSLCAITYGNLGMKKEWQEFVNSIEPKPEFIYKNQLKSTFSIVDVKLPAVFIEDNDQLKQIISAEEINSCKTIEELKSLIKNRNLKI